MPEGQFIPFPRLSHFTVELEEFGVACYPCISAEDIGALCRICETASCNPGQISISSGISAWTDDELTRIRRVLQRLTSLRIKNDDDAEDLVQETLLTATEKLPDCSLEKGPLVWCMGVLRKKVGNYYRKANRYTSLDRFEVPARGSRQRETRVQSPEAEVRQKELDALINRIIAEFPVQDRRPIELYLAGHPAWEIAEQLRPERYQNVVNRIYRGRKKLARQLARFGYAPAAHRSRSSGKRS